MMNRIIEIKMTCINVLAAAVLLVVLFTAPAWAVPEVSGMRITDVTTTSFSVVWMTDVAGEPNVQVYADVAKSVELSDRLTIVPMPAMNAEAAGAAREKGIMKVRVTGLKAGKSYYVRAEMRDPQNLVSVGYSPLTEVVTAQLTVPYRKESGNIKGFSNDVSEFHVYVRPEGLDSLGGLGDLVLVDVEGAACPVSAFVGDGLSAPAATLDLNNLYGTDGKSLDVLGSERFVITVYRSSMLSSLVHYRRSPVDGELVQVSEPVKGFFADLNLDRVVDEADFEMFRAQYRSVPEETKYNPDFDFVTDGTGIVDVREFSKFSQEYGRTGIE
jgi:hypothetical protein